MRIRHALPFAFVILLALPGIAQLEETKAYFSLASNRTYAPGENPSIQLWATGLNELQFRVYRVNDPVKFFTQLEDPHEFQASAPAPKPDETPIERFHRWKSRLRARLRNIVRAQYTADSRATIRAWMSAREQQPVATAEAGKTTYADVPLLNPQQVVAVWEQAVQRGKRRWESTNVVVPVNDSGVYLVEATNGDLRAYTIAMVSNLAVVTKVAPGSVLARVVNRTNGSPAADCPVILRIDDGDPRELRTGPGGLARIGIEEEKPETVLVMALRGDDFAITTPYSWYLSTDPDRHGVGYVYSDRPVYRPGHQVHFRGVLRNQLGNDYTLPPHGEAEAEVQGPDGKTVFRKTLDISDYGTVHDEFTLADDAALGYYYARLRVGESSSGGGFYVEEYRKPEYEVKVRPAERRYLQGETVAAEIEAKYYYGEPVAHAKVTYAVHQSRYWAPFFERDDEEDDYRDSGGKQVLNGKGELDTNGKLTSQSPSEPVEHDVIYRIEARVTDAGNREISGTGGVVLTVGRYLISIRGDKYVYQAGERAGFTVTARDYERNPVSGVDFRVELSEWNWRQRGGQVLSTIEGRTDDYGSAKIEMDVPDRGSLRARVISRTAEGREISGHSYLWVSGSSSWYSSRQQRLQLVPDKKSYQPGEVAKVLVVTGTEQADLWVTAEGREVSHTQFVKASGPTVTVEVPIRAEYAPNFYLTALFLKEHQLFQGSKSIKVPVTEQKLDVEVAASKDEFQPGETGTFTITAKDHQGRPVAAEFSIGVVDEAIYAVRNEAVRNIVSFFYGRTYNRVSSNSSLSFYFRGEAGDRSMRLARRNDAGGAGIMGEAAQLKPASLVQPKVRKAFPDTIHWLADLKTDAQSGRATTRVTFPDALTRFRATARGITRDTKVGGSRGYTIVRKNLVMSLSHPRFFTEGDEVTVRAIVRNYLDTEKTARVSLETEGLEIIDGETVDVTVPADSEVAVDYRVIARPGREAVLLGKALTNEESDALEMRVPIIPYGIKLTEGSSGVIDETGESTLTFRTEAGTVPHSRSIEIEVTSSVAGAILGALEYLTSYPYGCTEQTMSSFLPNVLVSQAAQELKLETGLDRGKLTKKVRAGLDRLYDFQHPDGGWGWWKGDESDVFMTAYVLTGLKHAEAAGYDVQRQSTRRAVDWLQNNWLDSANDKADLRAYALYALARGGYTDQAARHSVFNGRSSLTPYGKALLGLALQETGDARAETIAAELEAAAVTEAGGAYWNVDADPLLRLGRSTSPEATAHVLKFLNKARPGSPLLGKAAMWLVQNRDRGTYWNSTKQTALVIYGLVDYLKTGGELAPEFTAEVTLNGRPVLTRRFTRDEALSVEPVRVTLDASQLADGANTIAFSKQGEGRLYWSIEREFYTTEESLSRAGSGSLNLRREYFKLTPVRDDDRIIHTLTPLDGEVATGDILAVRLTLRGSRWDYLLIEDPIPAGTEFIQRTD
ncbi:MAG: alpha-2-macroglobulin, partial [bacterium]|nr:alpha-2-macroglobulin [bacterium]